jgi:predicted membrane protein
MASIAPLLGGLGISLLLYAFMNSSQSLQNSIVGIIAFVMLLQNMGRQGGFLWGLVFSAAGSISKGKTPSYIEVSRFLSGMTLGFALAVALSAMKLPWSTWLGAGFLILALIFIIAAKSKKEVSAA